MFNSKEKCKNHGHKIKTVKRETYRKPWNVPDGYDWYSVYQCDEEKNVCKRCKQEISDWKITYKEGFTGYSMPSDMAKELRKNGVVKISGDDNQPEDIFLIPAAIITLFIIMTLLVKA